VKTNLQTMSDTIEKVKCLIIESCLAHEEQNQVKASYNRSSKMKYFEEKKKLMQWWANWLN
jgi:mRNA degradation ribonuclease J1/J2